MAIWQYNFLVLPKDSISANDLKLGIDDDGYYDDVYWLKKPTPVLFFTDINKIMPKGKSWCDNLLVFGNLESNCFEVYSKNGFIQSASFRTNFTTDYEPILSQIVEFCILKGLIIVDEKLNITSLNLKTIKSVITNAPQVKKYNLLLNNNSPDIKLW